MTVKESLAVLVNQSEPIDPKGDVERYGLGAALSTTSPKHPIGQHNAFEVHNVENELGIVPVKIY